jgi:DNA-directed RNA polymerase subunit RPC12/RpoP
MSLFSFLNRLIDSLKKLFKKRETIEKIPIVEIKFKCDQCDQEFWSDNFNIAAFLYGIFLLIGKEREYVGLTCPNCLSTILVKENSDLVNYTKQNLSSAEHEMPFLFYLARDKDDDPDYSQGIIPFCPKLRYHSSVRSDPMKIPAIKNFDIPASFMPLTNDFENEFELTKEEHSELQEKYLCPYLSSVELPIGPYVFLWWFRDDQVDDLVKIENDEKLRIFPRYIHKISEIENIERFCWDYYLPDGSVSKTKTSLPSDFVNILTATPLWSEVPFTKLSSYEFLWKTPHPFEGNGVPRSLIDVDPTQFQKPKKTFSFDEIASEVQGYLKKGYGLNFISENYKVFIKEYIELANKTIFSYALVWELKEDYLQRLNEHMYKEARSKARYAFYSEGPTWTIIFDGKTLRGLTHKGFKYIHYLVKNKVKYFAHIDLDPIDGVTVVDTGKAEVDFKEDDQTHKKGKQTVDHESMIHGKSYREIKQEWKKLLETLEKAKRNDIPNEIKAAQKEYDEFTKFYYEYFTKNGKVKKFTKRDIKNIRDRIAKSINEALAEIKEYDPTHDKRIWKHFEDALGGLYRQSIAYRPIDDIDWCT